MYICEKMKLNWIILCVSMLCCHLTANAGEVVFFEDTFTAFNQEFSYIAIQAESFNVVTDEGFTWQDTTWQEETIKNSEWLVTPMADGSNGLGISNPFFVEAGPDWYNMGDFLGPHASILEYRVQFQTPGDYAMMYYSGSQQFNGGFSDTFWISEDTFGSGQGGFGTNPNYRLLTGNTGDLTWKTAWPLVWTVTEDMVGKPLTFKVAARERQVRLDGFILSELSSTNAIHNDPQIANSNEVQFIEAESYSRRSNETVKWEANASPGNEVYENYTGGSWISLNSNLAENTDAGNADPAQAPWVEYDISVNQAGVYNLLLRAAGIDANTNEAFISITNARKVGEEISGAYGSITTTENAFWDWKSAGDWEFDAAGDYTIRIIHAEAGIAIDSMRLIARNSPLQTRGDYNGDMVIDASDIDAMGAAILAETLDRRFDLNYDEVIDNHDMVEMVVGVADTFEGDFNLDGTVNISDLSVLASNYNQAGGWATGDANGDGFINIIDLSKLASNWSSTVNTGGIASALELINQSSTTIPEPTSLISIGLLSCFFVRPKTI